MPRFALFFFARHFLQRRALLIAMPFLILLGACSSPASMTSAPTADEIMATERAWLDAYEQNDREAMDRILADDFLITYSDGAKRTKDDTIAALNPAAGDNPNSRMYTENSSVRFFGNDLAVITGLYVYEATPPNGLGTRSESLYTDVYKWIDGRWQVISSHLSEPPVN